MHCPNCGTQASADQKFCRSCGLELQAISQLVTQQLAGQTITTPSERAVERRARVARLLFLGLCTLIGGAVVLEFEKRFELGTPGWLTGQILAFGGLLIMFYAVLRPTFFPQKTIRSLPSPVEPVVADTTSKLALTPAAEPVASITEHTTRTLEPVTAKSGDLA